MLRFRDDFPLIMIARNELGANLSYYESDSSGTVIKRQPLPEVKTVTAQRNVYNNSKSYKKQPYSYSITEMIRNQKTSYKEEQNKQSYYVNKMNRGCPPPQNDEKWNKYSNCVNGCD